jgi:hypothetical protein
MGGGGARFFTLATFVIAGIILADIIVHPQGTTAASNGIVSILTPSYNALLGGTTGSSKQA